MNSKPLISAVINVRNEAEVLDKCLSSIAELVDDLVIVDMKSSDNSVAIAKKYSARVFSYRPLSYVEPARNFGLSKAKGRWILLLDPDEYLGKTLKKELKKITTSNHVDFVKIPRKNIIFGKWLRHGNCWPDYLIRFFKKGAVTWQKKIHSQPKTKGEGLTLLDTDKLAIRHRNYISVTDFIHRALRYSQIQAKELKRANYKLKTSDLLLKPTQEFNSRFFSLQGYKDGLHGLVFALLQSIAISFIYLQLWDQTAKKDKILVKESFVSASQESTFEYSYWFSKYFKENYSKNIFKNFLIKLRHILNRLTKNL